jgi:prophage regulatory protein
MEQAILREKDVIRFVGLSRTSIWRKEQAGLFPARVRLGGGRAVGWLRSDLENWLSKLKKQNSDQV